MKRRQAVSVAAVISILFIAGILVVFTIHWRSQQLRHDAMREAVASFEPPAEWSGWSLVDRTSRSYSPLCIDVACPSHSERYLVAVPEGDLTTAVVTAVERMDIGGVTAPDRPCIALARCLYEVEGDDFTLELVVSDPFDFERNTVGDLPPNFVEISVSISTS